MRCPSKHPGPAYFTAFDYALVGEDAEALRYLQKALAGRRPEILNLQNDPELDHLRSDARFPEIVKKVGIPPVALAQSVTKR